MLFFKDLFDEKMDDPAFRSYYHQECHVCKITVKLVAFLEKNETLKEAAFAKTGVSKEAYTQLKQGDCCDPETVFLLCRVLGVETSGRETKCPRMK